MVGGDGRSDHPFCIFSNSWKRCDRCQMVTMQTDVDSFEVSQNATTRFRGEKKWYVEQSCCGLLAMHLVLNPSFQLIPVDGWQFLQVRTQLDGFVDINVLNLALRFFGIPMDQDAYTATKGPGNF